LGITPYCASVTQVRFWNLATAIGFGTVPIARPLMYQPVVEAMISTVPDEMFFISCWCRRGTG
jgi:hypothetical protein